MSGVHQYLLPDDVLVINVDIFVIQLILLNLFYLWIVVVLLFHWLINTPRQVDIATAFISVLALSQLRSLRLLPWLPIALFVICNHLEVFKIINEVLTITVLNRVSHEMRLVLIIHKHGAIVQVCLIYIHFHFVDLLVWISQVRIDNIAI